MDNGGIMYSNFKAPIPSNVIRGSGKLTWLSSKAGLIAANHPNQCVVSFQLKDFCDAGVTDLTTVLRPGFLLSFQAVPSETNDWIACLVTPLSDIDLTAENKENQEIDLESGDPAAAGNTRDPYAMELESQSIMYILQLFIQCRMNVIPLSNLHSRISNSGNDDMYRYIGSSSLKRRQFIERRSYLFGITENDAVYLQPPEMYSTVCALASFLLRRGGAAQSDAIFNYFNSSPLIARSIKESINHHRGRFVDFLNRHPFVFSPFPAKFYISVRRNIPYIDYTGYIKKNFPIYFSPNMQKQITYANTSHVAMAMQYNNNQFGTTGLLDDAVASGNRTPTASNWLNSDAMNPLTNTVTTNTTQPMPSAISAPSRQNSLMHNMMPSSNPDFLHRNDPFANASPPINEFKRTIDVGVQASSDVGIGVNVGCTCKCNCNASRVMRDANGFIPFFNVPPQYPGLMNELPTPRDLTPPGFGEDKFFSGRQIETKPTFSAAPGGPVSRTPSSQTPIDDNDRVFDPFAFSPFELKLRSLKL